MSLCKSDQINCRICASQTVDHRLDPGDALWGVELSGDPSEEDSKEFRSKRIVNLFPDTKRLKREHTIPTIMAG